MEYRTVKVPEWAYLNGKRLYSDIVENGISHIPGQIRKPSVCPHCRSPVNYVEAKYQYAECPNCSYRQQTFSVGTDMTEAIAAIGLGVLFGLAIAALTEALSGKEEGKKLNQPSLF